MSVPEPLPIEELYDRATLRRLGVDLSRLDDDEPGGTVTPDDRGARVEPTTWCAHVHGGVGGRGAEADPAAGLELDLEFEGDLAAASTDLADGGSAGRLDEVDQGDLEGGPEPSGGSSSRTRRPMANLMLAAALTGVGDALEPDRRQAAMVEFDPGHDHFSDRPVQYVHVPGSPRLSRILLRPWLAR